MKRVAIVYTPRPERGLVLSYQNNQRTNLQSITCVTFSCNQTTLIRLERIAPIISIHVTLNVNSKYRYAIRSNETFLSGPSFHILIKLETITHNVTLQGR